MQMMKGPERYPATEDQSLRALLERIVAETPERPAYLDREKPRAASRSLSYRDLLARIDALGTALLAPAFDEDLTALNPLQLAGMSRRRLAILGDNSTDWVVAQNAAIFGAGLAVPLDKQLAFPEMRSLLERARCSILFLHGHKEELLQAVLADPGPLRHLVLMGPGAYPDLPYEDTTSTAVFETRRPELRIWRLTDLEAYGAKRLAAGERAFQQFPLEPELPAAIFFTSGTTARSKGVVLSQKNILAVVRACRASIRLPEDGAALSVLPLHHTLENSAQYVLWEQRVAIAMNDGLRHIAYNMQNWPVRMMVVVPLLLDNLMNQVEHGIRKKGKEKLVKRLMAISNGLRKIGIDLRKKLFKSVRNAISPQLDTFIIGAAALKADTERFFDSIGMHCYVGYGMTETAPLISANNDFVHKLGSVGQPCAGIEVRIDEEYGTVPSEGEIQARCPNRMLYYYEDEAATAEVLTADGWLKTGDIGHLDEDGVLFITGRAKSMIVLTNGKKIFPEELEAQLDDLDGLKSVMVFGAENNREAIDVAALFHFPEEQFQAQYDGSETQLVAEVEARISALNATLPPYKAIKYWAWTTDELVMTSTLKVKRKPTEALLQSVLANQNQWIRDVSATRISLR